MSEKSVAVYVDLDEQPVLAGLLYARNRKGRESASFEYDKSWLSHPARFALEPALTLHPVPHHTPQGRALFGSIGDSAPDRWGRTLMRRAERKQAKSANREPRSLGEIDFLLRVDDETRPGALRFAEQPGQPFLAVLGTGQRVPPLIQLPRLLAASDRFIAEEDDDDDLRMLLAPGSSLGGARPKASVRDRDGRLLIAKFPQKGDEINLPAWESLALLLAEKSGITVTRHQVKKIARRSVLLVERFDREGDRRIPFLSAMSLLGAMDNEQHSYLEIAEGLRRYGGQANLDQIELWRRIVFSVLISNTDDHLRNHGLLWPGQPGWRLSPAFDLNPTPTDMRPRQLSTAIDEEDTTASLDLALSVAKQFGLSNPKAKTIAGEIGRQVSQWRQHAKAIGLVAREIERMASAFEHADLRKAESI